MNLPDFVIPLRGAVVNAYLLNDPQNLTLIDCGLPGISARLKWQLKKLGKQVSELKIIIITHADGDHYGGLPELSRASSAQVYTSQPELEAIQAGTSSRALIPSGLEVLVYKAVGLLFKTQPSRVDRNLVDGEVLPVLGGLRVIFTPGHTPGHISLFLPETRVLFSGDSIITGRHPRPSEGANTWNSQLARKSFELQMSLKPAWICAGHGMSRIKP